MDALGPSPPPHPPSSCTRALNGTIKLGRRSGVSPCCFPPVAEVRCGVLPAGKLEREPAFEQSLRDDTTALQNEFGFTPHECRTNLEHPVSGRQTERHTVRFSKRPHELRIGQWVRRCEVHGAVDVALLDQPPNRRDEILVVNPRHELTTVAGA